MILIHIFLIIGIICIFFEMYVQMFSHLKLNCFFTIDWKESFILGTRSLSDMYYARQMKTYLYTFTEYL